MICSILRVLAINFNPSFSSLDPVKSERNLTGLTYCRVIYTNKDEGQLFDSLISKEGGAGEKTG